MLGEYSSRRHRLGTNVPQGVDAGAIAIGQAARITTLLSAINLCLVDYRLRGDRGLPLERRYLGLQQFWIVCLRLRLDGSEPVTEATKIDRLEVYSRSRLAALG